MGLAPHAFHLQTVHFPLETRIVDVHPLIYRVFHGIW